MTTTTEARDAALFSLPTAMADPLDTVQVRIQFTATEVAWIRKNGITPQKMRDLIVGASLPARETLDRIRVMSKARALVRASFNRTGIAIAGDSFLTYSDEVAKHAHARKRLAQVEMTDDERAAVKALLTLLSSSPESRRFDSVTAVRLSREAHTALHEFAGDLDVVATRVARWLLAEALVAEGYKGSPLPRLGEAGSLSVVQKPELATTAIVARCSQALREAGIEVTADGVLMNDEVRVPVTA